MKKTISIIILSFIPMLIITGQSLSKVGEPFQIGADESVYLMSPRWSPDGSQISVTSNNYIGIYLISFPDGELTLLSEESAAGYGAKWSHDGKYIATRVAKFQDKRRYNAVVIFDAFDKTRREITEYKTSLPGIPFWTQDDSYLYLNHTDGFHSYSVDEKSTEPISGEILYVKKDNLFRRDTETKSEAKIDAISERIINIAYSPDNSRAALELLGGSLYVMEIESGELTSVGEGYRPVWSPDNKYIAFMVTEDDGHRYLAADIYTCRYDGSDRKNLTNTDNSLEMNPTWSPDGNFIAYDIHNTGVIYIQEVKY